MSARSCTSRALTAAANAQLRFSPGLPASTRTLPRMVRDAPGASVPIRQRAHPLPTRARRLDLSAAKATDAGGTSASFTSLAATEPVFVTLSLNGSRLRHARRAALS